MHSNNEILSKRLQVPPLKDDEVVEFRLIKADEKDLGRVGDDLTPGAGQHPPRSLGDHWFSSKETIIDPFENKRSRRKLIQNIVSARPNELPSGETKLEPIIEHLKFDESGRLFCSQNEFETYVFASRSNKNISNPFRDKKVKARFYRVDKGKLQLDKINDWDLRYDAMTIVRMADLGDLKTMLKNCPSNLTQDINPDNPDSIKVGLMNIADSYPVVIMKAGGGDKDKGKVAIIDAERYNVLLFDPQSRNYYFTNGPKDPICTVEVGENRIDALNEYLFSKEGGKQRAFLVKEMKTIYEAVG